MNYEVEKIIYSFYDLIMMFFSPKVLILATLELEFERGEFRFGLEIMV